MSVYVSAISVLLIADYGHKPSMNAVASIPSSYGSYPGPSKKIEIPNGRVGVIIGKGGETIKYLQLQSGAKIQVTRDMDADPNSPNRGVELTGTPDQIAKAEQLINDVLNEVDEKSCFCFTIACSCFMFFVLLFNLDLNRGEL